MMSIETFFENYGEASTGKSAARIADCYASDFIAAGPKGSMAFKNDDKFIEWLKNLHDFNDKAGMQKMIASNVQYTPIGENYFQAIVTWRAGFKGKENLTVDFLITYILFPEGDSYKIIMYISHEDQEEYMKEKGLL